MTGFKTAKTAVVGTVIAGLIGFSGAGLAQSKAIESMNNADTPDNTAATAPNYPMANDLANEIDRYYRQTREQGQLPTHAPTAEYSGSSRIARVMEQRVDDYYADADHARELDTHVPASESTPAHPAANTLAARLDAYNRNGGSRPN